MKDMQGTKDCRRNIRRGFRLSNSSISEAVFLSGVLFVVSVTVNRRNDYTEKQHTSPEKFATQFHLDPLSISLYTFGPQYQKTYTLSPPKLIPKIPLTDNRQKQYDDIIIHQIVIVISIFQKSELLDVYSTIARLKKKKTISLVQNLINISKIKHDSVYYLCYFCHKIFISHIQKFLFKSTYV